MAASPDPPDSNVTLQIAVVDLSNAARIPTKQRSVKITKVIDTIVAKAYDHGIPQDPLEELVDIITQPNELDLGSVATIVKNLYPASQVNDEIVLRVVGSFGHGEAKAAFPVQAALLKWLIMVYDVLENRKILSQAYSIIFNLLDTIAIRAPVCHLLSLITRRKHVRPFRIQTLLELSRRVGNEPSVIGLIRVYKDYYPDVIVGDATGGRASVFTHPNPEWRKHLNQIQEDYAQKVQHSLPTRQQAFKVARSGVSGIKRSKVAVVPEVHTSHAHESSVTLEEIESVTDFVQKLEKIELPNQLVSVIGDPLLQNLLLLKSDDTVERRIDSWLSAFFEDQLENGKYAGSTLLDMLAAIKDYASFTKTVPPACMKYLQSLLGDWNGVVGREVILELLTYISIGPFEDLYESTFQPLEYAIIDGSPDSQVALLGYYTSTLRQWTVSLLSSNPHAGASQTIIALTTHANKLALTLLQTSPTVNTHNRILSFYEMTAFLISQPSLQSNVRITTPPSTLIYTLYFSPSLSTLSRLCAILAIYKRAFEIAMTKATTTSSKTPATLEAPKTAEPNPPAEIYPKEYVNLFNGFLMDICNCVWRSRAFNTADNKADINALGCLLPAPLLPLLTSYVSKLDTRLSLPALFNLSHSSVLCNLSIQYMRELEDKAVAEGGIPDAGDEDEVRKGRMAPITIRHAGPVTADSLKQLVLEGGVNLSWTAYRTNVLRFLEAKGVTGVGDLMRNTLKNFMNSKEGTAMAKG